MKRIKNSDYKSFQGLLNQSKQYSFKEIQGLLDSILLKWQKNKITIAVLYAQIKFIYLYLKYNKITKSFKNHTPIPIGYFAPFLRINAMVLFTYLKTSNWNVRLFQLDKTFRAFKNFIINKKSPVVLFTLSQFHYVDFLKELEAFLNEEEVRVFVGGRIFDYDESLKLIFPKFLYPESPNELILLLNRHFQGEKLLAR